MGRLYPGAMSLKKFAEYLHLGGLEREVWKKHKNGNHSRSSDVVEVDVNG